MDSKMNDKIINIYNLDNFKTDCNYFTIRILFQNNEIINLEIDGETHNKKKITLSQQPQSDLLFLQFIDLINEYGFDHTLIGIKINHNINECVNYFSNNIRYKGVYNGQVIIDHIVDKFTFVFNKGFLNGYIQINIYEIYSCYVKSMGVYLNAIVFDYNFHSVITKTINYNYRFSNRTIYFKIRSEFFQYLTDNKSIKNKYIKLIELPFANKEGKIHLECYKICNMYYYFVISKIIYDGEIITMTQNIKCDCIDYLLINFVKTENEFSNKIKRCTCFLNRIFKKLTELKIYEYDIPKNIFEEKLQLKDPGEFTHHCIF